ncbi:MAG: hypothetical protein GWO04_29810, partial [Actinobacteria bacterium]|nr:hypothetical protein [Actinomycetota bacterium]
GIRIEATETSTISSVAVAAAASIALGGGVAAGGAGVTSNNTITNTVAAFILSSGNVRSALGVVVLADDKATISAVIVSVSLSAGFSAIAIGVSLASNIISDDVSASIAGSSVTALGGDISGTATYVPTVTTVSVTAAIAAGVGGAGAGADSNVAIGGTTEASIDGSSLTASDHLVSFAANSTVNAAPSTIAVGAGLAAVAAMTSNATVTGATRA